MPVLLTGLFPSLANGQNDSCAQATVVTGLSQIAFDNASATTSGFVGGGNCGGFMQQDMFWQWTAPSTGDFAFDTFGSGFDTVLSVHQGIGCSAICAGSNDNAGMGSLESEVIVSGITQGDRFLIQVGSFHLYSGAGVINITQTSTPCAGLSEDPMEPNQTCAQGPTLSAGTYADLYVSATGDDYFAVSLQPGEKLNARILSDNPGDVDLELFDGQCDHMEDDAFEVSVHNLESIPRNYFIRTYLDTSTNQMPCAVYDLEIEIEADPCFPVGDDALEDNDLCETAPRMADGTYPGLFVKKWDKDVYYVCVPKDGTIQIDLLFDHAIGDIDMFLMPIYSYPCAIGQAGLHFTSSRSLSDDESITWTNNAPQEQACFIEVVVFEDSEGSCNQYDLVISGNGVCTLGTRFCDPANVNSTGVPARIVADGSLSVGDNELTLQAYELPIGQFGYFLASQAPGMVSNPGSSQGNLCLAGGSFIYRFNAPGQILQATGGSFSVGVNMNMFPGPQGAVAVQTGETWYYQCWYRDLVGGTSTSNFTDAVRVGYY